MERKIIPGVVEKQELVGVAPTASVAEAVKVMHQRHIGAVLVFDGTRLAGIFTERDVVNRVVAVGRDPVTTQVSEVMTADPDTLAPDDTADNALALMSARGYRHLPVLEDGKVVGMVSIRDLFATVRKELEEDLREREKFIFGGEYGAA